MESLSPIQIGSLTIDPPIFLAPMAGYTDLPFRRICASMVCTEIIMSEGVMRYDLRTMSFLTSDPAERPVAAQFYGTRAPAMAEAAKVVESLERFDAIDLNFGCPHRRIQNKGAGAAMMERPKEVYRLVAAVRQAATLPVTVKTRLGVNEEHPRIAQIASAAEEAGADALTVHARFAEHRHSGPARWEALAEVKASCGIPVIGNGGLTCGAEILDMVRQTGVDGTMVGRAAIGNPWVFQEIRAFLSGETYQPPDDRERYAMMSEHLQALHRHMAEANAQRRRPHPDVERAACHRFLAHLVKYLRGRTGLHTFLAACGHEITVEEMLAGIRRILHIDGQV